MYQIKLNKNQKNFTLKNVERSVKLIQKKATIKLNQTGRRGLPGADSDKNFVQNFTNSAEVTVTHNLEKYPAVTITDSTGDQVEGNVEHLSINELIATFSSSFTGKIVCN